MYDSSGRYPGGSQAAGGNAPMGAVGNYAAPPPPGPQGQPGQMARHNNPGQIQYSSYNPNSANARSGAGGYINGAGVMENPPPPHPFMAAPPPQGPPMPQQQSPYDISNNGAPYYNQRMPPPPQNSCTLSYKS